MSFPIFEALGIQSKNLSIETSVVSTLEPSKQTKLDEGLIQKLYKIESEGFIENCSNLIATSLHIIFTKENSLFIDSAEVLALKSEVLDLALNQETLYILYKNSIVLFNIASMSEVFAYELLDPYNKIKINSYGSFFFVIGNNKILKAEENKLLNLNIFEVITGFDLVVDCDELICAVFDSKKLQVINHNSHKVVCEYISELNIDQVCSVSDSILIIYCSSQFSIHAYNFKEKEIIYSILFNSKIEKQFLYCAETEQLVVFNKNSSKLLILSLDDEACVTKFALFGLKNPIKDLKHTVIENNLRNQPLYEGNSKHKFFIFHENIINIYSLEVISTKTAGFRYGKEPFSLVLNDDQDLNNPLPVKEKEQRAEAFVIGKSYAKDEKLEIFQKKANFIEKKANFIEKKEKFIEKKENFIEKKVEIEDKNERKYEKKDEKVANISDYIEALKSTISEEKISKVIQSATQKFHPKLKQTLELDTKASINSILSCPIQEIVKKNFEPLESSISLGIDRIFTMQNELSTLLNNISSSLFIKNEVFDAKLSEESLQDIVKNKNKTALKRKIDLLGFDEVLNLELSDDFGFDLGHLLIEIIEEGYTKGKKLLEPLCSKINTESSRFGEFFIRITVSGSPMFKNSLEILETRF